MAEAGVHHGQGLGEQDHTRHQVQTGVKGAVRQQALSRGTGKTFSIILYQSNIHLKVVQCANETKTVIVSKPKEECDMEPQETCRFITKMVPHLRSREECVEVPQEVCGTSRAPIKKKRPSIMNWCYIPIYNIPDESGLTPSPPPPPPGQVLLKEVQFRDFALASPDDLATLGDEISIELFGEKTVGSPDGVSCSFSFDDLQSYGSSIIDDKEMTLSDQKDLGGCFKVKYPWNKKSISQLILTIL